MKQKNNPNSDIEKAIVEFEKDFPKIMGKYKVHAFPKEAFYDLRESLRQSLLSIREQAYAEGFTKGSDNMYFETRRELPMSYQKGLKEGQAFKGKANRESYLRGFEEGKKKRQEQVIELFDNIMDAKKAKAIGDTLEEYHGIRLCKLCGYNPEHQRQFMLNKLKAISLIKKI